jgi:signal transduction histidine kinase
LDDLGLIPALLSFTKELAHRTGLHIRLNAFAGVEKLDPAQKTVLYRVAQEAVTNVDRHAKATHVVMVIRKAGNGVSMRITDDGRSFDVDQAFRSKRCRHLGVLGMRERLEMIGGSFTLVSAKGKGTSIEAYLPFNDGRRSLKTTKSVSQTIP